jgi:hypothetical protein
MLVLSCVLPGRECKAKIAAMGSPIGAGTGHGVWALTVSWRQVQQKTRHARFHYDQSTSASITRCVLDFHAPEPRRETGVFLRAPAYRSTAPASEPEPPGRFAAGECPRLAVLLPCTNHLLVIRRDTLGPSKVDRPAPRCLNVRLSSMSFYGCRFL